MIYLMNTISKLAQAALVSLALLVMPATAAAGEDPPQMGSASALAVDGVVSAIDLQSREVSLSVALGIVFTVFVPESLDLENLSVGDQVSVKYFTAEEIELRKPTAEEIADPWIVIEEGAVAADAGELGADAARRVRAVVTVVIIDKANERIAVTDSRGMAHFIMNVEPEKMTNLTEGQQVVVVFTEATIVTLDKKS
jgi:hypothetical protein